MTYIRLCAGITEPAKAVRASFVRSCPVNCEYWGTSTGQFEGCLFLRPNFSSSAGMIVLARMVMRERASEVDEGNTLRLRAAFLGLVELRLLDGWNTSRGLRISEESIMRFKKKYVSLASIAREIGHDFANFLMRHCARKHIPIVMSIPV